MFILFNSDNIINCTEYQMYVRLIYIEGKNCEMLNGNRISEENHEAEVLGDF